MLSSPQHNSGDWSCAVIVSLNNHAVASDYLLSQQATAVKPANIIVPPC